jgi:hypothetical protein
MNVIAARRTFGVVAMLLGTALLSIARPVAAASARIQYISSSNVYLDAGSAAGLVEGAVVRVERDGKVIAELVVEFVAQNSASCRVQSSTEPLKPNDSVTFTPATVAGVQSPALAPSTSDARSSSLRGRFGVLMLRTSDASGHLDNPVLVGDVTWRGSRRNQLDLRFRGDHPRRQTHLASTTLEEDESRIYEASIRYRSAESRLEIEAGRLLPERLELLGAMDGGGLHWRPHAALRFGVAGGGATEYVSTPFVTGGYKLGGFVEAGPGGRWRALAAFGHVEDPEITRRQYVQLRGDARIRGRMRVYENLEIDLSPAWKRDLGAPGTELTAFSVGMQLDPHPRLDVSLGYETRRPLLVPEQRALPAPIARDLQHGGRAAARLALTRQWSLRLGGDTRLQSADDTRAYSLDAHLRGSRVGPLDLSMHASYYDMEQTRGEILDASVSWPINAGFRCEVACGDYQSRNNTELAGGGEPESHWSWLRTGAQFTTTWGLWLSASGEWRSADQGSELVVEAMQQF